MRNVNLKTDIAVVLILYFHVPTAYEKGQSYVLLYLQIWKFMCVHQILAFEVFMLYQPIVEPT